MIMTALYVLLSVALVHVSSARVDVKPWNLPVFPSVLPDFSHMMENSKGKLIPRHLWMGFKTIPPKEERSEFLTTFLDRTASHNWTIHLMDDSATDLFMDTYFSNTSTHWAYHMINPEIGPAKGDIWRYCALYLFGGFYLDDDSYIESPLDDMIQEQDQAVLTVERNRDANACFMPYYRLSVQCLNERFNRTTQSLFGGHVLVQWGMAAMPHHRLFMRAIETVVDTIRSQFLQAPVVYVGRYDTGSKWIYCSTGPSMFSAVVRELFLEQELIQEHQHSHPQHEHHLQDQTEHIKERQLRPGDANFTYTFAVYNLDFQLFGGQYKPVDVDLTKTYMHRMHHYHISLIKHVRHHSLESLEGHVVSANGRELFLVENGLRRGFQDWDAFVDNQFTLNAKITISEEFLQSIPQNATLITSQEAPEGIARRAEVARVGSRYRVCIDPFAAT